jgi:uncharacterized SAM-binding protein YcdF (DUF218 family)
MFFHSAKLLHFFLRPSNVWLLALLLAVLSMVVGLLGLGGILLAIVLVGGVLIAWTPLPYWLLRPLEETHPSFDPRQMTPAVPVRGIILLGGGINTSRGDKPNGPIFTSAGSRVITTLELARFFPTATILLSGGAPYQRGQDEHSEASLTRDLLTRLGISADRILLEEKSRDTFENAQESEKLLTQQEGKWLLVTSAAHMPRALASFGSLATRLIPCCADYKTQGTLDGDRFFGSAAHGWLCCDIAIHEWMGMIAYRLSGRINRLPSFR